MRPRAYPAGWRGMSRSLVLLALGAVLLLVAGVPRARGAGFMESFDAEPADAGPPEQFSVFGAEVVDRGVTTATSASAPQSAFVVLDFSGSAFGGVLVHDPVPACELTGMTLSVRLQADADLAAGPGGVGFQLVDSDGTTVRTADADLFRHGSTFQRFEQPVSALTTVDDGGADFVMDLSQVVQYGILFLDRGDRSDVVTFHIDDFEAAVPVAIDSVTPASVAPGTTVAIVIFGSGTAFAAGATVAVSGEGIVVGEVTVRSPTELEAEMTVATDASASLRDITVANGASLVTGTRLLRVLGPGEVFRHSFDREAADDGVPDGFGVFGTEVTDRRVSDRASVSAPHAASLTIDLSGEDFGAVLLREPVEGFVLGGGFLSVHLRASADFADKAGLVGFQLVDADGTTVRTPDAQLFRPTTAFEEFRQIPSQLTTIDDGGADFRMDYRNVVQYGLLFLDRGDVESAVTFETDDFRAGRRRAAHDYDGDGRRDMAVFDPATSFWFLDGSTAGFAFHRLGFTGTAPVPADFDGDDIWDRSVFEPESAIWMRQQTSAGNDEQQFGFRGVIPVPCDYDGDGEADIAVFDPYSATWFLARSTDGFVTHRFGFRGVQPVPADYDGDNRCDIAVYDPPSGTWFIFQSTDGFETQQFGFSATVPVACDYDGDGAADIAVFEPRTGTWFMIGTQAGFSTHQFGFPGVVPVPGDYDGDGRADLAVYDPRTGNWFVMASTAGFSVTPFGFFGAAPLGGRF